MPKSLSDHDFSEAHQGEGFVLEDGDKLFDAVDQLVQAIGDDAFSLVKHLGEGIEEFKVHAVLIFGFAALYAISMLTLVSLSRPELLGTLPYYAIVTFSIGVVSYILWHGWKTMSIYKSYRARYARMIETAKRFEEVKKSHGRQ